MLLSLVISLAAFSVLIWRARSINASAGLPNAYLFCLLLQHLPGGLAHLVGGWYFAESETTEIGMRLTAIGVVSFVVGVVAAQKFCGARIRRDHIFLAGQNISAFSKFCLLGGWLVLFLGVSLTRIPSVGAAISQASSVWILGVSAGLLISFKKQNWTIFICWISSLFVYPAITLLNAGFLSFGLIPVSVCFFFLVIQIKSNIQAFSVIALFSMLCFFAFLSYFQNRDHVRDSVWGGDDLKKRLEASSSIITDIGIFDSANAAHLSALDQRLNQSFFAGSAALRIDSGQVDFLHGKSVVEGLQAMVPRAIWPDKPIFAGSSEMIRQMSGFEVNENTSFGVGQVMEFYINFGIPSLIVGFLLFGFIFGWLDNKLAVALINGNFGDSFLWFLPSVGMLAPLASISEIMGNVVAAAVAAFVWRYIWSQWKSRRAGRYEERFKHNNKKKIYIEN